MPGTKKSGNRTGNPRAAGAGRPPSQAVIRDGDGVMITQVYPDGTANLGQGRAVITKIGRGRLIALLQPDGSEIRILIPK